MRTLARSSRRTAHNGGAFLDPIFRPLEDHKIRARMGTTTFVAGPPGAMKTAMVLYWVLRLNKPTLYFSADAEDFEVVERAAAAMSGDTMDQVRANGPGKYQDQLASVSNIRFVFEDAPTYSDVELEVAAFIEVHGRPPEIIVIDNLMNVVGDQENEWASMRESSRFLHRLTRTTKAAVFVLHHMADDRIDPTTPAPRSKLQGKIGQLPKVILSLALDGDVLKVAPVKTRWGPGDASGCTFAELYVDASRNRVFNSRFDMIAGRSA